MSLSCKSYLASFKSFIVSPIWYCAISFKPLNRLMSCSDFRSSISAGIATGTTGDCCYPTVCHCGVTIGKRGGDEGSSLYWATAIALLAAENIELLELLKVWRNPDPRFWVTGSGVDGLIFVFVLVLVLALLSDALIS